MADQYKFDPETGLLSLIDRLGERPVAYITSAGMGHVTDTGLLIAELLTRRAAVLWSHDPDARKAFDDSMAALRSRRSST